MPDELRRIIPTPPPAADIFATYQATRQFYRELEYRQEFKTYCQWYNATAESNRRDLEKMRGDINILGWFNRRRG